MEVEYRILACKVDYTKWQRDNRIQKNIFLCRQSSTVTYDNASNSGLFIQISASSVDMTADDDGKMAETICAVPQR